MYADKITDSMQRTIDSTNYRRAKQFKFNEENNITPRQIIKPTREIIGYEFRSEKYDARSYNGGADHPDIAADPVVAYMTSEALEKAIKATKKQMEAAAKRLEFIEAAQLRDEMYRLQELLREKTRGEKQKL
jgi:excinuclease ABC subunit B